MCLIIFRFTLGLFTVDNKSSDENRCRKSTCFIVPTRFLAVGKKLSCLFWVQKINKKSISKTSHQKKIGHKDIKIKNQNKELKKKIRGSECLGQQKNSLDCTFRKYSTNNKDIYLINKIEEVQQLAIPNVLKITKVDLICLFTRNLFVDYSAINAVAQKSFFYLFKNRRFDKGLQDCKLSNQKSCR